MCKTHGLGICIYTYIHTYILHTYIHTYIHTHMHTYMQSDMLLRALNRETQNQDEWNKTFGGGDALVCRDESRAVVERSTCEYACVYINIYIYIDIYVHTYIYVFHVWMYVG